MRPLVTYFVKNYRVTFLITFALVVVGLWGAKNLIKEGRPPVDFGQVMIVTPYPGASAKEIEKNITDKIEVAIKSLNGIDKVISYSRTGVSEINAFININDFESEDVISKVERTVQGITSLPKDANDPQVIHFKAEQIPILQIGISGDDPNLQSDLAYKLQKEIEVIPGIAFVNSSTP